MVTIHCLECDAELTISDMAEAGDLITCLACNAAFEVVAINPVEIDFADEIDSAADGAELAILDDDIAGADASSEVLGDDWSAAWDADEAEIDDLDEIQDDNLDEDSDGEDLDDLDDEDDEQEAGEEDDWLGTWEDDDDVDWDADDDDDDDWDVSWEDDKLAWDDDSD
jgi:hypothetical protein